MEFFEAVEKRRSVRRFKSEPLDGSLVERVIRAAMSAPSAGNMQPWEFVIVDDAAKRDALIQATYTGYMRGTGRPQAWMASAPVLLVVCMNHKRSSARYGEKGRGLAAADCAAAVENALLAATALGLGSCWVGGFDEAGVSEVISCPPDAEPFAILPLGWPDYEPTTPPKLGYEDVVWRNSFGERAT